MKQKMIDLFRDMSNTLSIIAHDCEKYGNCETCVNYRATSYKVPYTCGIKRLNDLFRELRYEIELEDRNKNPTPN